MRYVNVSIARSKDGLRVYYLKADSKMFFFF